MKDYAITIRTDRPYAEEVVRAAARLIAEELDWGNNFTTSIEAVEGEGEFQYPRYLAGYEMEPER